jgi:hypothetical protein
MQQILNISVKIILVFLDYIYFLIFYDVLV